MQMDSANCHLRPGARRVGGQYIASGIGYYRARHQSWDAIDHAAYRGALNLGMVLLQPRKTKTVDIRPSHSRCNQEKTKSRKERRVPHGCNPEQCCVSVNIGSFDPERRLSLSTFHPTNEVRHELSCPTQLVPRDFSHGWP
jgi:hypothetical protein